MKLTIQIEGASELEMKRGIAAVERFLADAGVTPYQAAAARFKLEGEQEELTEEEDRWATLWEEADEVALKACCEGWAVMPGWARLELSRD